MSFLLQEWVYRAFSMTYSIWVDCVVVQFLWILWVILEQCFLAEMLCNVVLTLVKIQPVLANHEASSNYPQDNVECHDWWQKIIDQSPMSIAVVKWVGGVEFGVCFLTITLFFKDMSKRSTYHIPHYTLFLFSWLFFVSPTYQVLYRLNWDWWMLAVSICDTENSLNLSTVYVQTKQKVNSADPVCFPAVTTWNLYFT